jgi:hypothetical protein
VGIVSSDASDPAACAASWPVDEASRVVARQRVERQGVVPPGWAQLEQLGPGRRDQEQRSIPGPREVLDHVEERRHGPVHVVEHDHDRAVGGEVLDQPAGGGERGVRARELAEVGRGRVELRGVRGQLAQREERDPLAVGRARRLEQDGGDVLDERCHKAALADAGFADDDRMVGLARLDHTVERRLKGRQLVGSPDERSLTGCRA